MSRPNVPDSDFPSRLALERVIRCLAADLQATRRVRDLVPAGPGGTDLGYLDRLIYKPWGSEFRVYEDELADVWCLHIKSGRRTSLHCHLRKRTALLCLDGEGSLSTCSGVQYALAPGVVLQIEPGAYHRTTASSPTGLRLLEVETPKDKLDLLRIEDDYRAPGEPYEGEDHAPLGQLEHGFELTAPLALQPFVEQRLEGDRRARLRAQGSTGHHRFAVQTGERVHASTNLVFAVALEPRAMSARGLTVLVPDTVFAANPESLYLTVCVL